jgi:hypothetical protein
MEKKENGVDKHQAQKFKEQLTKQARTLVADGGSCGMRRIPRGRPAAVSPAPRSAAPDALHACRSSQAPPGAAARQWDGGDGSANRAGRFFE